MIVSDGEIVPFVANQSLAETTPMLSTGYFPGQDWVQLSAMGATYAQIYRKQLWVYVVCRKIGMATARLTFKCWEQTDTGKIPADDTPYAKVLARPNPKLSAFAMWLWTASTIEIYGEAFWVKIRGQDGNVTGLWPMHPTRTVIRRDNDDNTVYMFTLGSINGALVEFPEADVVPFLSYNPDNGMRGMSQLEPLRQTLLSEDASRRATASWWARGARPSVALVHPNNLSAAAAERLRASWEVRHAGADLMGGTAVLEEGMKPEILQLSSEEMQYIESRKLNREEVCAAADIPPPVVQILDHATFSNITEQMRSMYRDTMAPRLEHLESILDLHLRPDFDQSGMLHGAFALDEVLRGDFEVRATAVSQLITNGVMKPSEARPLFDLPDAGPEADRLYGNAALVPLGSNPAPTVAPLPPVKRAKAWDRRSVLGSLSRVKANRARSRTQLVSAHAAAVSDAFARQRQAVTDAIAAGQSDPFDPSAWNDDLVGTLTPLAETTAESEGGRIVKQFGGGWSVDDAKAWLAVYATNAAKSINETTGQQITDALSSDDPSGAVGSVFDDAQGSRSDQIAQTQVTGVGNFAEHDAATTAGLTSKTWTVTSANPRAEHAAMDGETVALDDEFSSGQRWPGDGGDPDQCAGCTCMLDYSKDDSQ